MQHRAVQRRLLPALEEVPCNITVAALFNRKSAPKNKSILGTYENKSFPRDGRKLVFEKYFPNEPTVPILEGSFINDTGQVSWLPDHPPPVLPAGHLYIKCPAVAIQGSYPVTVAGPLRIRT